VEESTIVSPWHVSQFGDLSIGDFLSDHIVTGRLIEAFEDCTGEHIIYPRNSIINSRRA